MCDTKSLCGAKLCMTLCDPVDHSPTGSSVHGILQARILEWVAISSSRGSSWPRKQTHVSHVSCIGFSFSSVAQSCSTLQPHGLQHARPPCPSPTPRVYSNSCPLDRWYHPTISSSVVPFSSCLQSFPASQFFQMSQFFLSGGQSIGVSASVLVLPNEYSGLLSFRMDLLGLLAVQRL